MTEGGSLGEELVGRSLSEGEARVEASLVLALDSSAGVQVGVARDGEVLARASVDDSRQHVEQLVPLISQAMAEAGVELAEVDLFTVGLGPGPFTGLRVGIVAAQVLAQLYARPLHGVCSLDVVAAEVVAGGPRTGEFVVASDARRKELYWARYDAAGQRIGEPQVSAPSDLPDLPVTGPGAAVYADQLGERVFPGPTQIDAGLMAQLNLALPSAGVEPLYLRRPDAAEPTRRKSTLVAKPRIRKSPRTKTSAAGQLGEAEQLDGSESQR